jgi:hypothetical protein
MPRPYIGPKLWLDPKRGTYTILDGRKRTRTGFTELEHDKACEALLAYAGGAPLAKPPVGPRRPGDADRRAGVYVVGFGPYVKIGVTRNLTERMAQIQTPEKVNLYAFFDGERSSYEGFLHRRFDEYRMHGEWFRRDGDLAAWINGGCQ